MGPSGGGAHSKNLIICSAGSAFPKTLRSTLGQVALSFSLLSGGGSTEFEWTSFKDGRDRKVPINT